MKQIDKETFFTYSLRSCSLDKFMVNELVEEGISWNEETCASNEFLLDTSLRSFSLTFVMFCRKIFT